MVNSMNKWIGKVAIVTGASSGIGAAIAKRLVEKGLLVVGLARRSQKIEEIALELKDSPGKLYAYKTDMTIESDIVNAINWTKENLGPISILINNAGISKLMDMTDLSTEWTKAIFDTNVVGLCVATTEVVKNMEENKTDGHIIHICSLTAHINLIAEIGVYGASKTAVSVLAESLRKQLRKKNSKIKVSLITPGGVNSNIHEPERLSKIAKSDTLQKWSMLEPNDIADTVEYTLSTSSNVQVFEVIVRPVGEPF